MLIEFTVKNFLCFKEETTFSMVASSFTENPENTFKTDCFSERLLKSAVIYGANASGKSNLFKALKFMRWMITSSFEEIKPGQKIPVEPFLLSTETEKAPSFFETTFIEEGVRYRYGFTLDQNEIKSEWLYYVPKKRETMLFERENGAFILSGKFKEGKILTDKTRNNALFVSVCAQFNGEISKEILDWYQKLKVVFDTHHLRIVIMEFLSYKNENFLKDLIKYLKIADIGISDVVLQKEKFNFTSMEGIPQEIANFILSSTDSENSKEDDESELIDILLGHTKFDELQKKVGNTYFSLEKESRGTVKLLELFLPLIASLHSGYVVLIDEIASSLHPHIAQKLIKLFNSEQNQKNAQLIFNTHDTNLLATDLFRRDQVWFVEKDEYGSSDLYSLAEFKVRKDASFKKDYLLGKYGAVPFLGNFESLILLEESDNEE